MAIQPLAERSAAVSVVESAETEAKNGSISDSKAELLTRLDKREKLLRVTSLAASQFLSAPWRVSLESTLDALGNATAVSCAWVVEIQASGSETAQWQWSRSDIEVPDSQARAQWNERAWNTISASHQLVQLTAGACDALESAFLTQRGVQSLIAAPIRVENELWGYFGLENAAPRDWESCEIEVLQLLADLTGAALTRERRETTFRASESELSALFAAMRDAIFVTDGNGRYLKVVANDPTLVVRSPNQLIGKTFAEVMERDLAREFLGVVRDVLNTESLRSLEYPLKIEGRNFWFFASVTPLSAETVLWVARDVTAEHEARESLRESEKLFRLLTENSSDKIARLTPAGVFLYISPSAKSLLGYDLDEIVGTAALDWIHPEDKPLVAQTLRNLVEVASVAEVISYRMRHKNGEYIWFETNLRLVGEAHDGNYEIHTVSRDVSARYAAEEALREAEAKYRSIFENAVEGIFRSTPDGTFIGANPSLARIYGYDSPDQLQNQLSNISKQLYISSRRRHDFIAEMAENGAVANFEAQVRRKDGEVIWISENARAVCDAQGDLLYYEGTVEDITARKNAESQLLHDALHDKLTGLSNRALFMDRLGQAFARLKRAPKARFAALFLDFDRFKNVNDSLGHMAGDELLIALAGRIAHCLRPGDTVSRLGGDEFAILLENIDDVNCAISVAARIQDAMAPPFTIVGQEVFTSASIGIAMGHADYQHPEELLRDADMAMYRAKALGKARHHVFDVGMHQRAVALLQLETDLRHAIERDEFRLVYQPIVDLESGRIAGFEALVRWHHPTRGLVSPADFIPIAEETGWIVPIGRYVLEAACQQISQWRSELPQENTLSMSVNLSSKQFSQRDLLSEIEDVLRRHTLPAAILKLEITESAIMERAEEITDRLFELRQLGVQLSLDDFGTGYSSLSYLHRFPLNTLKIDRSFVARMAEDGENHEIVRTIISLGRNLGMDVVAEGIEDALQLAELRKLGCNCGQGYFFARPLGAEQALELLKTAPIW